MIKVLIVIPSLSIGGAQRFCLNIVKQIPANEMSYEIAALRRLAPNEIGMEQEFRAVSEHLTLFNSKKVVFSLPKLIGYIKEYKPDIILSTVNNVDFWVSAVKLLFPKVRLIIRKANVIFNTSKADSLILKSKLPYKIADKIVVLTQDMEDIYLKDGVKSDKLAVINNMVNVNDPRIICAGKAKQGKDKNSVNIVNIARLVPEKRHDILIDAFAKLAAVYDNCTLTLVGGGPEEEKLRNLVPEELRSRITFAGFQTNPYEFLGQADIFCLTSDYEGFPNVVIEAFACGLPVVATDCPTGPREIIQPGVNGFLADKGDSSSVCECLAKLVCNPELRSSIGKNALEASKKYSPDVISEQYFQLFREVLEK